MGLLRQVAVFLSVFLTSTAISRVNAQAPAEFYRGKTVELYIGTSTGGAYDTYARILARHLKKHIPGNPNVVPKNMPGAGGLALANYMYSVAPKDGSTLGIISRGLAFDPLLGNKSAQYDGTKFNWIGSTNNEISVCVAWHTTGITKLDDVMGRELVVGATGPSADTYQFPKIVNAVLGTKFKIVTGYPGGNDVDLAMERGEVQGRCSWSWTSVKGLHQPWLDQNKLNILFQMGLSKHRDLPDVPLILDLAKTEEARSILKLVFARQVMAWPFLAPPDVPPDRIEALREAFMNATKDPEYLADAEKAGLESNPVSGHDLQRLVREVYGTPTPITSKAAEMLR